MGMGNDVPTCDLDVPRSPVRSQKIEQRGEINSAAENFESREGGKAE